MKVAWFLILLKLTWEGKQTSKVILPFRREISLSPLHEVIGLWSDSLMGSSYFCQSTMTLLVNRKGFFSSYDRKFTIKSSEIKSPTMMLLYFCTRNCLGYHQRSLSPRRLKPGRFTTFGEYYLCNLTDCKAIKLLPWNICGSILA